VHRCAAADADRDARRARQIAPAQLAGRPLLVDGFNCLITVEAALSGGLVLRGRDRVHRDLASVHGGWRRVDETERALTLLGEAIATAAPADVLWLLDRPISNSGRLAALIRERAAAAGWSWRVELHDNPDRLLAAATTVSATGDSAILDRCGPWIDLPAEVIRTLASPWMLDLGGD
jgi:hypothetical protein